MLTEAARAQGVADCLAKFAIDAAGLAQLEALYGHDPQLRLQKTLEHLEANKTVGPTLPPVGAGNQVSYDPRNTSVGRAPPPSPIITAAPLDKTFIGSVPDAAPPAPTKPVAASGVPVGSAAGTNVGRNPLLRPRPIR